jgi:Trk-type K+ transport system membrane component
MGYPNTNSSFSAQFTTVSKLVIIAMQIRGRHRGLPYELDRAVRLVLFLKSSWCTYTFILSGFITKGAA